MFKKVPQKLLDTFSKFINSNENYTIKCVNYSKWFRFYWDFCIKYNFPDMDPDTLSHILQKLKEKGNNKQSITEAITSAIK